MSIESVMPSTHLILCRPLLLLPSIFPSIRAFSTAQGNRLSCRDQEGRRGSEEAVPGPSVFPSGEPGVSGPRPWDSPGKNTGVGCYFLLQCMKVKSESEVAQLATPWMNGMTGD